MTLLLMDTGTGAEARPEDVVDLDVAAALRLQAAITTVRQDLNVLADAVRERLEHARTVGELDGASGTTDGVVWKRSNSARWDATATWATLARLGSEGLVPEAVAQAACPELPVRKPDGKRLSSLVLELGRSAPQAASDLAACNQGRPYWKAEVQA